MSSVYKLSFNSNCFAWSLCLDDVINKLLKRLLVSFKPIVNSLGLMDHFNCNALGENWIFAQRIGTDTLSSWLNPNENSFAVHRDLAKPLLGVHDEDYIDDTLSTKSCESESRLFDIGILDLWQEV